jgi:nucleotide-binding universal stress UspA family protein
VVNPQIQETAMYRRILVAYDGSPESRLAVDECVHLSLQPERHIHLACVLHDPSPYLLAGEFVPAPTLEIDRTRSEKDLKDAAARLIERGFSVTTHLLDGEPVEVITRLVDTLRIDLLIVGHKRSKKWALRWWRGSVDALLIERVRCSILLASEPAVH